MAPGQNVALITVLKSEGNSTKPHTVNILGNDEHREACVSGANAHSTAARVEFCLVTAVVIIILTDVNK